jgi:glyoxylase-like metal-dependent hydrolase (beta-lactamase superfamily II)
MKRRSLLKSAAWCAAASVLAPLATQARAARVALVTESLAPGVLWIRGAGANVLVVRDARGLCFLDGGLAANAPAVLALARRELGAKDAHTLINTHWHPEHTGLNETLGKSGARIIAHENTRLWLGTAIEQPAGKPIGPLSPKARPNSTTYTEGEIAVGDEVVRYGYLPQAHTDGDLYVHLRRANVLFTGGVVAGKGWSTVDYFTGGWINGMVGGYRSLTQLCTAETRIVTAQGERLMSRQQLDEERTLLARLSDQLGKMLRSGYGPADVLAAAPAKEFEARYGDSTEFLTQSFKSLWGHMAPDA